MVSIYGLNKRVGNISFYDSQGRDMFTKPYSEDTAKIIDEEVSKLVESQYQRALDVLKDNKEKLEQLANKLLTAEVIFKEDLEEIFGKRIWDKEEPKIEEILPKKEEDESNETLSLNQSENGEDNSGNEDKTVNEDSADKNPEDSKQNEEEDLSKDE
jgi:cell division protease FtsH